MARTKRTASRENPEPRENIFDPLVEQLDKTPAGQLAGLQELTGLQQQRAKRLSQVIKRLSETLGPEHPRVVALNRKVLRASQLQQAAEAPLKRTQRLPKVDEYSWLLIGHVIYADGQPASGLRVLLAEANNKPVDGVKPVKTDKLGDFSLVVNVPALKEQYGNKMPTFLLQISDNKGSALFSSQTPLSPAEGTADYFDITLAQKI